MILIISRLSDQGGIWPKRADPQKSSDLEMLLADGSADHKLNSIVKSH